MRFAERSELLGRAGVFKAAAGIHVWQHHDLFGAEDLGRVGHELDSAKRDHIRVGIGRHLAQLQTVADEIRQILNVRCLVVMRQDNRIALLAQPVDLRAQVGASRHGDVSSHGGSRLNRVILYIERTGRMTRAARSWNCMRH
jgi:hypothetical protein